MVRIYPYQQRILDSLMQYNGRGMLQVAGRQLGKSQLAAYARIYDDIHSQPLSDLILSEGQVYGARYYCIQPVGGQWHEIETWCLDTFGSPGDHMWGEKKAPKPGYRWYMNNRKFWFRDLKDRDWFIMRWRS